MPRFVLAASLVLGLVFATAMTRPADATEKAQTAALTAEAHALVAEMQHTARAATDAHHPLALLDTPEMFQALTIYRDAGAFRVTAHAPGEGLLTVSNAEGTPCLRVRFDHARILSTESLV